MNSEDQQTREALRDIATELRRFRRAVLAGFAALCFIAGLLMVCYPYYLIPMTACFIAAGGLILLECWSRLWRGVRRLWRETREEVQRQHSSRTTMSKGADRTPGA